MYALYTYSTYIHISLVPVIVWKVKYILQRPILFRFVFTSLKLFPTKSPMNIIHSDHHYDYFHQIKWTYYFLKCVLIAERSFMHSSSSCNSFSVGWTVIYYDHMDEMLFSMSCLYYWLCLSTSQSWTLAHESADMIK